ncbi:cytochrome P450 4c21-like [Aricia agestis]|uniref:cytochrome P450 4c21-like n=1 Tax=Aricia agestis TaxID=91739 RepID=UPI001C207173|nr:cytochrome P450 4c21-like [Aricia agestis]
MDLWIVSCGLIGIIYVVLTIFKWRKGRYLSHLPSWPYLPLLGNMHLLLGSKEHIFRQLLQITDAMEKSGLPFVFWVGNYPALVISDPDEAKLASNACIEKPHQYSFAREWLGNGLVTAPGHIWKKNIKMMAGAFSSQVVSNYQAIFNEQAKKLVEMMKTKIDRGPFDAKQIIAHATLEAICQTALGIPDISKSIATKEYYDAFTKTLEKLIERGLNIFLHPQFIYRSTKAYKEYMKHVMVLRNVSGKVLRKLDLNEKDTEVRKSNENDLSGPRVKSFLDILHNLSKSNANMTEEEIKSEVNTIIFAGQETVATTLHFIFIMIGSREDVQKKLYKEIKEIFGDTKRDVNREDLEEMVYCEGVINETLRLYPSVPVVLRKVDTDIQLRDCLLPKGSFFVLNMWASGRLKRLWGPDVLDFRPERWREPTPPILAFSIGKRACIGKRYAMQILKTILAYCIQDLIFKSDPEELKLKIDVTLRTHAGDLIQVGLRNSK